MGAIFSYAIASSLLLCMGYLAYKWIMAGERQHGCNRATLYIIYALALTLPAFAGGWEDMLHSASNSQNAAIELGNLSGGLILREKPAEASAYTVPIILTYIYAAGVILTLIYSLAGAFQLVSIIRECEKVRKGNYILVISERNDIAPFSWLNYYVMSRNDYETAGEIISIHERRHLRLWHWVDLLFVQIVDIFQWFNPAAWLMGEEFKTVHEYQADEAVMASGTNLRQYQTLLIKKAVGTRFQVLANSLNHSKLKKRVTMMYKSKPSKLRRFGALLLIPAMGIGCAVIEIPAVASVLDKTAEVSFISADNGKVSDFSANQVHESVEIFNNPTQQPSFAEEDPTLHENTHSDSMDEKTINNDGAYSESITEIPDNKKISSNNDPTQSNNQGIFYATFTPTESAAPQSDSKEKEKGEKEVYVAVEKQAEFPGGIAALMNWLSMNIRYPEKAYKENIQGRVIVKFIIEKDGKVSNPTIVRGIDPELDKESIRVVKEMPAWQPAENNGKAVASYFNLPISFKLTDDSAKKEDTTTPPAK